MVERRIHLIVEDVRFRDLLVPAIRDLGTQAGVQLSIETPTVLWGCRGPLLQECLRRLSGCDVVVIGADAGGATHRRRISYRQKHQGLSRLAGGGPPPRSLAVAEPSVEAWIMADPQAFAAGLTEGLRRPVAVPPTSAIPRTERGAKEQLGRTIQRVVGEPLARSGFEYAELIVANSDLLNSRSESLRSWARDFRRLVEASSSAPFSTAPPRESQQP
jgi:hypothetical protein